MHGLLLKSHVLSTCERAYLLNRRFSDFRVWGGIAPNNTVGGLNPAATRAAIKMGAAQIWMPTKAAANYVLQLGGSGDLTVLAGRKPKSEVQEILLQIAAADIILGTGHLAPEESVALAEVALEVGVKRICVTHPEWGVTAMPVETQQRLAATGRVWFER